MLHGESGDIDAPEVLDCFITAESISSGDNPAVHQGEVQHIEILFWRRCVEEWEQNELAGRSE